MFWNDTSVTNDFLGNGRQVLKPPLVLPVAAQGTQQMLNLLAVLKHIDESEQ
jgi:hypothetical protein